MIYKKLYKLIKFNNFDRFIFSYFNPYFIFRFVWFNKTYIQLVIHYTCKKPSSNHLF